MSGILLSALCILRCSMLSATFTDEETEANRNTETRSDWNGIKTPNCQTILSLLEGKELQQVSENFTQLHS